jgi:hypothetical protein
MTTRHAEASVWRCNAPLVVAALLAFSGVLRLQLAKRREDALMPTVETTLWTALDAGVARKQLAFPASLAPHAPFEIEAPRCAVLYASTSTEAALTPARCEGTRCTYELGHHDAANARQIIAQFAEVGRYVFAVLQRTGYGEVRGSIALHVQP